MTRPIAKAANVNARTRRRQVSPNLLRAALVLALAASCASAVPVVLGALRPAQSADGAALPPVQVALSGLAAGACMSLSPSGSNAGKTVFIDPGHGGMDPGVVGTVGGRQVLEKDVTLAVGTRLAELLRADGYRVVLSRTGDSSVTKLSATDSVAGAMTASAVHRDLVTRTLCANSVRSEEHTSELQSQSNLVCR